MHDTSSHASVVTPSDTVLLAHTSSAIWVGGLGNLTITMMGGEVVTLTAVPAGTWLPLRVKQVWATGTTATLILALWDW